MTITDMYRTGSPRYWTVKLDCGHKRVVPNAEVKKQQLFVAKTGVYCTECVTRVLQWCKGAPHA